jgi:putative membrane-bound dehydrogenase-like protein
MRYVPIAAACCLLSIAGVWAEETPTSTQPVALNGHNFTLPEGFEIELAAGPPLVDRPITADFDEQGRLYVAESSGSNEKVNIQLEKKPHRILRLEDTNGDGRFDKRTVFADRVMFPEGTMWLDGSLYVAAPPSIWKFTDTNDDGIADERVEWFQGKTLTGCANDLHGPYAGPDGWIYWCKGAFAQQTYTLPNGKNWSTRASHIFRCRPDGSGLEPVMTGGMDNPVDVIFTNTGERIFSCTFLQNPGGGRRDGLIHAVYGGIYGKDHDPIYEHLWTSPQLMPVLSHLGPAAPCGLARYESSVFGDAYRNNLFTACFNMRKVARTVLSQQGAAYTSRDEDFLVSDHVDFHPTDVLEDADGSLLVVDTGGWYKLCCPTSQIEKPDVLGAIYRVRRKGAARVQDPRGLKLAWSKLTSNELVSLLADARPAVQRRAIAALSDQGAKSLAVVDDTLHKSESVVVRRNAAWTACQIGTPEALRLLREALNDDDETVRGVALHAISLHRDQESFPSLVELLASKSTFDQRLAAEALGRLGNAKAVPAILKAIENETENAPVLDHALTFALIEINSPEATKLGLQSKQPQGRRAALAALDQMAKKTLTAEMLLAEIDSTDEALRETAAWIVGRHPEWGGKLVEHYRSRLRKENVTPAEQEQLARQLGKLAKSPEIQALLAEVVKDEATAPAASFIALNAMQRAGLAQVPEAWHAALAQHLGRAKNTRLDAALQTARTLAREKQKPADLMAMLIRLGENAALTPEQRLEALAALPTGVLQPSSDLLHFVRQQLCASESARSRSLAGEVLAKAKLTESQILTVCDDLGSINPLELDSTLKAITQSTSDAVGLKLVEVLQSSPQRTSIPVGLLRQRLAKFGPAVQQQAEKLYGELDAAAQQQKVKLEALLTSLPPGDFRRGQAVFHSAKAACSSCHAIGYAGGRVGPDLTRIGQVRTERDLLESVLFPSNSFVQGYEPTVLVTTDGKTYSGLVRDASPDEVTLITGANQSVRLARGDIEETQLGKLSVMPVGLDGQLSPQQLADLIAYLKSCR